jgi:hypothetical protein
MSEGFVHEDGSPEVSNTHAFGFIFRPFLLPPLSVKLSLIRTVVDVSNILFKALAEILMNKITIAFGNLCLLSTRTSSHDSRLPIIDDIGIFSIELIQNFSDLLLINVGDIIVMIVSIFIPILDLGFTLHQAESISIEHVNRGVKLRLH